MGVAKMPILPKICPTYPTMIKLDTFIPYLKKIQKHVNHVTHPSSSTGISIFYRKLETIVISRIADVDCILLHYF